MTPAGWIFMTCSLGFVLTLLTFCFHRILTKPASTEHEPAPLDTDTPARRP